MFCFWLLICVVYVFLKNLISCFVVIMYSGVLTFIVLCNHQSNASLQDALHPFSYDDMSSLSNNQDSLDSSSSFVTPRNVKGSTLSSPPGHTLKSTAHSKNLDFNTKTPSTFVEIKKEMSEWSPDDDLPLSNQRAELSNEGNTLHWKGYAYREKQNNKTTTMFVCKSQRSCKCSGRVRLLKNLGKFEQVHEHSEKCKARHQGGTPFGSGGQPDLTEFQRNLIEKLSSDPSKTAGTIADEVVFESNNIGGPYLGMSKSNVSTFSGFPVSLFKPLYPVSRISFLMFVSPFSFRLLTWCIPSVKNSIKPTRLARWRIYT